MCFVSFKSHSISSMFHRAMLDAQLSSLFPTPFPAATPNPTSTPSLLHLRRVRPLPLCKEVCSLAAWLNNALSHIFSTVAFLFEQKHICRGIASSARASHEEQKSIVDQNREKLLISGVERNEIRFYISIKKTSNKEILFAVQG